MKSSKFLLILGVCFSLSGPFLSTCFSLEEPTRREMVFIPSGEYTAGSDGFKDEYPQQKVFLDAFFIDL